MQENVKLEQAEDILKGFKLPPRPSIFAQLKKVTPDLDKMSLIIEHDPALSASILKVVNSPAIGLSSKITSIKHAMSLLGIRSLMNIINAAFLKRSLSCYDNEEALESYWRSSMKAAAAISAIARKLNFQQYGISVDDAYCLGLFHNVGMPMMLDKHADYLELLRPAYGNVDIGIVEAENRIFDTNHTVLGFYMTKGWGLPKLISEVIKIHHNMEIVDNLETLDENVAMLLCALKMAEQISGEAEELGRVEYNKEWAGQCSTITNFMGLSIHDFFELEDYIQDAIEQELEGLDD